VLATEVQGNLPEISKLSEPHDHSLERSQGKLSINGTCIPMVSWFGLVLGKISRFFFKGEIW
jgi:hypothetical protein